jgi:CTP:molybdopterin cytidylyltransferase MocA
MIERAFFQIIEQLGAINMGVPLGKAASLCAGKIVSCSHREPTEIRSETPVLIVLAAGKGTRFGKQPKCIQGVHGKPLARHSVDAFRQLSSAPSICLVGYEADQVARRLGDDNLFVLTDDPTGGTAMAAIEAFSIEQLLRVNPIVVVTMGDRIVPENIFRRLLQTHTAGGQEAALTLLTAIYEPPGNHGKGRIARGRDGRIEQIVEQRDIALIQSLDRRRHFESQTEGNCPVYVLRAATLRHYLGNVTPDNAQRQYYFTDIVEAICQDNGLIRSVTIRPGDAEYDIVCADVTRVEDLPRLERALARHHHQVGPTLSDTFVEDAAQRIRQDRSQGQTNAIAAQLEELLAAGQLTDFGFDPAKPIGIGISGGRLRIAIMHPDMGRFFGPAWQMPIGAADQSGREQIVVLIQAADDNRIRLLPLEKEFREEINEIPADLTCMYPGEDVGDGYAYESFGTNMTQVLLSNLGYYSDEAMARMRRQGESLPDASTWVASAMRRPFSLLANAIASIRTVRSGDAGRLVQACLGRQRFRGLRIASTGNLPQGGFSSSSAVTVAVINAIDALFQFQFSCDQKVDLACQAEYGTGVRAGALDQATEQKGKHRVGAVISSNPKDNYRILGTFDVPADRFRVLFPYSVDRDRTAWEWSAGMYAATVGDSRLTAVEMRKMTGKASELAALLTRLPIDIDFFQEIQQELLETGELTRTSNLHVRDRLRQIPLRIEQSHLRESLCQHLDWYVGQHRRTDPTYTHQHAKQRFDSLFDGWRDPMLCRTTREGEVIDESGAPLRAMVAYLYAEVAKNFYMIHHPDQWIEWVTRSQRGDRCVDVDLDALPSRREMLQECSWERDVSGADRMQRWLQHLCAKPFDFNRGIENDALSNDEWCILQVAGTNFFRGLALIDLAEAMLKRAFGDSAVAVRVNGAGQGDYFQVHVDTQRAAVEEVKGFIRQAIYRRFDLAPKQAFVEPHPGGGAVGVQLAQYDQMPELVQTLRKLRPGSLRSSAHTKHTKTSEMTEQ